VFFRRQENSELAAGLGSIGWSTDTGDNGGEFSCDLNSIPASGDFRA